MNESLLDDLKIQVEWVQKLHGPDELKRRFVDRTFEETFYAIGKKVDADHVNPAWLGFEILVDSPRLEEMIYMLFE
jgi:hypothetical protein